MGLGEMVPISKYAELYNVARLNLFATFIHMFPDSIFHMFIGFLII